MHLIETNQGQLFLIKHIYQIILHRNSCGQQCLDPGLCVGSLTRAAGYLTVVSCVIGGRTAKCDRGFKPRSHLAALWSVAWHGVRSREQVTRTCVYMQATSKNFFSVVFCCLHDDLDCGMLWTVPSYWYLYLGAITELSRQKWRQNCIYFAWHISE